MRNDAPTSDCDFFDLFRLLIDPLLAADLLSGTHELFEFLNLLGKGSRDAEMRAGIPSPVPLPLLGLCSASSFLSPGRAVTATGLERSHPQEGCHHALELRPYQKAKNEGDTGKKSPSVWELLCSSG